MYILVFNKKKHEFVILYKVITLNVQGKCTNCKRVYKLTFLIGFEYFDPKTSFQGPILIR